jgi:class 3 adenylate cyclase
MAISCPSCHHANRPGRRFCAKCGSRLGDVCVACGTQNEAGEDFCGGCGERLDRAPASGPSVAGQGSEADTGGLPAGERRQLTVLFCDLVGSTALAAGMDPEDWRQVVTQYHQAAAEAVGRFGGHAARKVGDGLLVYFGWLIHHGPELVVPSAGPPSLVDADAARQGMELVKGRRRLPTGGGQASGPRIVPRAGGQSGRPSRLTRTMHGQLVAAVRRTGFLSPAARLCGVSEAAVQEWVARGRGTHPRRSKTSRVM